MATGGSGGGHAHAVSGHGNGPGVGQFLMAKVGQFSVAIDRCGLPLCNLTSQLWANRYLDPIDHLVKDRLRHRAYLRYMDDMLRFHDDRAALQRLGRTLEEACWSLRLRLHPWEVRPTHGGVSFVG